MKDTDNTYSAASDENHQSEWLALTLLLQALVLSWQSWALLAGSAAA